MNSFSFKLTRKLKQCKFRSKLFDIFIRNYPHSFLATIPPRGYSFYMEKKKTVSKEKIIRRLKLLEGQIRGLQKMVENDTYCIDIITQTSAVKQGLSNVEDILLEKNISHCVVNQVRSGEAEKAKAEILKVYQLKRK